MTGETNVVEPIANSELGISATLGGNVPRYTSYPTANHFAAGQGRSLAKDFHRAISESPSVSVYIHIPYCDRMCWFCGCHTKQTNRYLPIKKYIKILCQEMELLHSVLRRRPSLTRLHLGGGSPSLLQSAELVDLRTALEKCFEFSTTADINIEIDPSDVTNDTLENLELFGMTRASIGVQDFDAVVQKAINRPQSFELTSEVVKALRAQGVQSLNIDMLYGLPHQTPERLADTTSKVIALSPDRIALFGYAHVPWMKPQQKLIPETSLPSPRQRLSDASSSARAILAAGYLQVGIDHFAKPTDSLAFSARQGNLRRNFQGYVEDDCDVLIGLGASSISSFPGGYLQNKVATGRYTAAIETGQFAYDRGIVINADDRARGWIIERIMCDFGFRKADLEERFGNASEHYWLLAKSVADGNFKNFVQLEDGAFAVAEQAKPFTRSIAARFDNRLAPDATRHSAAV